MKLNELTAHEILELYKQKKTSPSEVYQSVTDQIKGHDKAIHAYIRLFDNKPENLKTKPNNDSYPIPIGIKDNMCILDRETTCCSRILEGFRSPYDATVIKKLKKSDAIFIGNTNMDEFA